MIDWHASTNRIVIVVVHTVIRETLTVVEYVATLGAGQFDDLQTTFGQCGGRLGHECRQRFAELQW